MKRMKINLKYGNAGLSFQLEKRNLLGVLTPPSAPKIRDLKDELKRSFRKPLNSPPLAKLLGSKKVKKTVILVEDKTRVNPEYPLILHELISELKFSGISNPEFIVAYGTHSRHSPQDNLKTYGAEALKYRFIHHDCDDRKMLSAIGRLSTGSELVINKAAAEADFIIALGNIEPHPFAGYTGGRKAILPGVSSRETVSRNHALVARGGTGPCRLEGNPIHAEMTEAAKLAGVDFILNIVRNSDREIAKLVSGDAFAAFNSGVALSKKLCEVRVKKKADALILSCGGYPKDINLYHAQKPLSLASHIVKENGTILLVSECGGGFGQPVFEKWLRRFSLDQILGKKESEIEVEGHRAFLTAKIMKRCEIVLVSRLPKRSVEKMNFTWKKNINEALEYIRVKHGKDYGAYVIPEGSFMVPVL